MKALLLWFGTLAFFTPSAQAENFYSPLLCKGDTAYIKVQNKDSSPQSFWFQSLGASPFVEAHVEVKAHGELTLPLQEYYSNQETAIALKTQTGLLSFQLYCPTQPKPWTVENAPSPWKTLALPPGEPRLRLHLVNLSQQTNPLQIHYEFPWGRGASQTVTLSEDFLSTEVELKIPFGATSLSVQGQGRWSGKVFTLKALELPFKDVTMILPSPSPAEPATRYFLFASQSADSRDSLVVPMQSAKLIAETLDQIAHPEQARLLMAQIEKSPAGFNRDFSSPVKSPWSWQVVEAQNYADFAHISCDGTPALVEERLNAWLVETGGMICFWNYRVVRELSWEEISQGRPSHRSSPPALGSLRHGH